MSDAFEFDPERDRKTQEFRGAAVVMRDMGAQLRGEVAVLLDDRAETCSCCSSARWLNFPQKQLRDRIIGAAERLEEIAAVLERRARDRDFLGNSSQSAGLKT